MNSSCIFVPYLQSFITTNGKLIAPKKYSGRPHFLSQILPCRVQWKSASKDESWSFPPTMLPSRSTGTFINTLLLNSECKRKRSLLLKSIHSSFLSLCLRIFCDQTHLLPLSETKIYPAQCKC